MVRWISNSIGRLSNCESQSTSAAFRSFFLSRMAYRFPWLDGVCSRRGGRIGLAEQRSGLHPAQRNLCGELCWAISGFHRGQTMRRPGPNGRYPQLSLYRFTSHEFGALTFDGILSGNHSESRLHPTRQVAPLDALHYLHHVHQARTNWNDLQGDVERSPIFALQPKRFTSRSCHLVVFRSLGHEPRCLCGEGNNPSSNSDVQAEIGGTCVGHDS
mmetsp:Transcript_46939/g.95663  ORF Transcript_46939/g.95663 Transcript_46939/m.95663 type:complete len:215 (+) Transcript_46939:723-1367(+)